MTRRSTSKAPAAASTAATAAPSSGRPPGSHTPRRLQQPPRRQHLVRRPAAPAAVRRAPGARHPLLRVHEPRARRRALCLAPPDCSFPAECSSELPCLTDLYLRYVRAGEEVLHGMIANSPAIETMVLDTNFDHRRLRLRLPWPRHLAVSLERLMLDEVTPGPSATITGATKLKVLCYLGTGIPTLAIGGSVFK
ncbi:hypothetical protein ACP70R_024101 [Stipagrostis hirtigluma subsp. patula]